MTPTLATHVSPSLTLDGGHSCIPAIERFYLALPRSFMFRICPFIGRSFPCRHLVVISTCMVGRIGVAATRRSPMA